MRKAVLDRAVEIETSPGEGKWESRAILLTEGQGPEVEKEFYGFGEDREAAEEMVEILVINYLKKKWKKERLRGQMAGD
jgi:hypothetical protein